MDGYTIIWTLQAKQDLKEIYEYWKKKSAQGAKNVRSHPEKPQNHLLPKAVSS